MYFPAFGQFSARPLRYSNDLFDIDGICPFSAKHEMPDHISISCCVVSLARPQDLNLAPRNQLRVIKPRLRDGATPRR